MDLSFKEHLTNTDTFLFCVELVTTRGIILEKRGKKVLELARRLVEYDRIHALSITDNPGGNAMLSPDTLGTDLISRGQEIIIHLSCKDWNRNALQSRAWTLASAGFNNILTLSGDYPTGGYQGDSAPVFDIDSVGLLEMLNEMNRGMQVEGPKRGSVELLDRTNFFLGTVVSPFKLHERELMPQYFKLEQKIASGAAFVITQIGFDSRKLDELLRYMAVKGMRVPVIANVYVLSRVAARFFHQGAIPGCIVSSKLMELVEKQGASRDKGKGFFLEFAAKQIAVARGLGYRGVYLGGHLAFRDYRKIMEIEESFGPEDWRIFAKDISFPQPGEFYYFEPDNQTGLNSTQINRTYLASKKETSLKTARSKIPKGYKFNRFFHHRVFEKGSLGFRIGKRVFTKIENGGKRLKAITHAAEYALKATAFDCRDCGDCSLPDIAYLCPDSQCAKNQRNGPCGGTRQGTCEVGEKKCIWSLAYDRLKAYGEEEKMLRRPPVFRDGSLRGTSAWGNTFLGLDHNAKKDGGTGSSSPDNHQLPPD